MKINKNWFFYGDPLFIANLLAAVIEDFFVVQGLRIHAFTAGGTGLIPVPPGQESSTYHAVLPRWLRSK